MGFNSVFKGLITFMIIRNIIRLLYECVFEGKDLSDVCRNPSWNIALGSYSSILTQ